jgi:hypothetical protein
VTDRSRTVRRRPAAARIGSAGCRQQVQHQTEEAAVGDSSWTFLLVGSFAALGAALAIGTLAAMWRHHRTGTMPGSDEVVILTPQRRAALWGRVGIGIVLTLVGVEALRRVGIL